MSQRATTSERDRARATAPGRGGRATVALAALLLAAPLAGCGFMVKHPAAGAAITGGTLALATCELASSEHRRCALVSGGAGALLGLAVLGALWLGTEDADSVAVALAEEDAATRAGRRNPRRPPPAPPPEPPAPAPAPVVVPPYLKTTPAEVYVRTGAQIAPAPAEDQAVAASYAASPIRGPIKDGMRITILTARSRYQIGEEVRVIHVVDAPEPGHQLRVMGPKPVHGELVDGVERTPRPPAVQTYDGRVVASPAVDYNYEITSYRFDAPGIHLIQWKLDGRDSNVIAIDVAKPAPAPAPAP